MRSSTHKVARPPDAFREVDHYRRALDAIPGHVVILDARQAGAPIVFANSSAASDYGYTASELMGQRFDTLANIGESNRPEVDWIREVITSGRASRAEFEVTRRDGSKFIAGMSFATLTDSQGETTHYVCSGRDITLIVEEQRKRRELQEQLYSEMRERERMAIELRLAQKLESVGRLASGIAHEINTPIQYVGDGVEFLKSAVADLQQLTQAYQHAVQELSRGAARGPILEQLAATDASIDRTFIEAEIPAAFERTLEGIERVTSIVRAMKEFAHPDRNELNPADINHAIQTTLLVARNEYKYVAQLDTELGDLPSVVCNVNELNQVFLNLIVNAAHAIEAAGHDANSGRITIHTSVASDRVLIVVSDNGCGIPAENVERIFDPFFTTKEVGKGTGQGLAITRSIIVEKHAGSINVESTVGTGTRIILSLPIAGPTVAAV